MRTQLDQIVDDYVESIRTDFIKDGKAKGLAWANSPDLITSVFESFLFVYGNNFIDNIQMTFGISQKEASKLFGEAKARIYDKYSK